MITFEEIKKANESIQTTPIKNKEYAQVNQRVKAFRMCFPKGFITTNVVTDADVCSCVCEVGYYTEGGGRILLARGTAREEKNASNINRTSYVENCETSAVGRALGFCGFGIDTSICSAEELENALDAQDEVAKNEQDEIEELKKVLNEKLVMAASFAGHTIGATKKHIAEVSGVRVPKVKEDFEALIKVCEEIITDNEKEAENGH